MNNTEVWRKSIKTEITTAGETSVEVESIASRIITTSSIVDTFQIGRYDAFITIYMINVFTSMSKVYS